MGAECTKPANDVADTHSKQTVAIITGNSNSGSACIKELFERYPDKLNVRGIFRSADKAKQLQEKYPKLEVVVDVDASKPDTLNKAFLNAHSAVIVTPHDPTKGFSDDAKLTENMINAAVRNGVKYIVYVGSFTVNYPDKIKIISSRFTPSEALLRKLGDEKGIKWTSLRGGFFMENFFGMTAKSIKSESVFAFPNVFVPPIDTRYIGKSAAALVANPDDKHNKKYYEMNGPDLLSATDISNVFSKVLGREIKWFELSKEDVAKMPPPLAEIFLHFIESGKNAAPFKGDVKALTGNNGSLENFVRDHINEFK